MNPFASVILLLAPAALAQQPHDQLLRHWDYDQNAPLDIKQAGIQKRGA
jgi:hypothetical protein